MNRPALFTLLALIALLPSIAAHGDGHHHPQVRDAHHTPDAPARGQNVDVEIELANTTNVSEVRLVYCRVQHYACGPALVMRNPAGTHYFATIPWTSRFFDDVTTVGYRAEIEYDNGTLASSPIQHYPYRPVDLIEESDTYYYYELPTPKTASASGLVIALLVLALVAVVRR